MLEICSQIDPHWSALHIDPSCPGNYRLWNCTYWIDYNSAGAFSNWMFLNECNASWHVSKAWIQHNWFIFLIPISSIVKSADFSRQLNDFLGKGFFPLIILVSCGGKLKTIYYLVTENFNHTSWLGLMTP